jgi:hypothetical protein
MTFRIEQKIILGPVESYKIYSYFCSKGMSPLYPRRQINSLYFDNRSGGSYLDSEEGCLPRKKIRVRNYGGNSDKLFEVKTSSYEGRYKTSVTINEAEYLKHLQDGVFDKSYGLCMPILSVCYFRDYYSYMGIRITIDRKIEYKTFSTFHTFRDTHCVLEFKAHAGTSLDFLDGLVSTPLSRFSKYSRGYQNLIA